jgi:large subunit ribosomal protein L25
MKTVEIIGYNRANLGKTESRDLRLAGSVPCVLYGGNEQYHFSTPMYLFKDLVYTPEAAFVKVNIEGREFSALLQDVQFHPVNDMILHADFLQLFDDKQVKMQVPVRTVGTSPGVMAGGKLISKQRTLTVKAFPKDMPDFIPVDISKLELGKSARVSEITPENYQILNNPSTPILTVEIPRALRGKGAQGE